MRLLWIWRGSRSLHTAFCLTLIYATEIPTRLLSWNRGGRIIGLFQFVSGGWLMYCTYAMTVNLALGAKGWI
jgi:hypothetical protein